MIIFENKNSSSVMTCKLISPQTLSVASVKHIRDGQQFADLVMFAPFRLFKSKKVTFLFTTKTAQPPWPPLVETSHCKEDKVGCSH